MATAVRESSRPTPTATETVPSTGARANQDRKTRGTRRNREAGTGSVLLKAKSARVPPPGTIATHAEGRVERTAYVLDEEDTVDYAICLRRIGDLRVLAPNDLAAGGDETEFLSGGEGRATRSANGRRREQRVCTKQ